MHMTRECDKPRTQIKSTTSYNSIEFYLYNTKYSPVQIIIIEDLLWQEVMYNCNIYNRYTKNTHKNATPRA